MLKRINKRIREKLPTDEWDDADEVEDIYDFLKKKTNGYYQIHLEIERQIFKPSIFGNPLLSIFRHELDKRDIDKILNIILKKARPC